MSINDWPGLDELSAELADFYRDLHRNPELSLQEHRTAGKVAASLRSAGWEVTEEVGGTDGAGTPPSPRRLSIQCARGGSLPCPATTHRNSHW